MYSWTLLTPLTSTLPDKGFLISGQESFSPPPRLKIQTLNTQGCISLPSLRSIAPHAASGLVQHKECSQLNTSSHVAIQAFLIDVLTTAMTSAEDSLLALGQGDAFNLLTQWKALPLFIDRFHINFCHPIDEHFEDPVSHKIASLAAMP